MSTGKVRKPVTYTLTPNVWQAVPVGAPSILIPLTFPGSVNNLPIGRIEYMFEAEPAGSGAFPQYSCNGGVCHLAQAGLWYVRHVGSTLPMTVHVFEVSGDAEASAYVDVSVGNFVDFGDVQVVTELTQIADPNPFRTGMLVQNLTLSSTSILRVSDSVTVSATVGARVGPMGTLDLSGPFNFKGALWAFPETASINVIVIEASR